MGCLRSDRGYFFTSFSRWTSSSWILVGGLLYTWPLHWGTLSVPVYSWRMVQMWAGRIAVAGQVGTPAYSSPTARVSPASDPHLPCDISSPSASASRGCEYPRPGASAAGAAVPGLPEGGEAFGRHPHAPGEAAQGEDQPLSLPILALNRVCGKDLAILLIVLQAQDFYVEMKWEFTSWGKRG